MTRESRSSAIMPVTYGGLCHGAPLRAPHRTTPTSLPPCAHMCAVRRMTSGAGRCMHACAPAGPAAHASRSEPVFHSDSLTRNTSHAWLLDGPGADAAPAAGPFIGHHTTPACHHANLINPVPPGQTVHDSQHPLIRPTPPLFPLPEEARHVSTPAPPPAHSPPSSSFCPATRRYTRRSSRMPNQLGSGTRRTCRHSGCFHVFSSHVAPSSTSPTATTVSPR